MTPITANLAMPANQRNRMLEGTQAHRGLAAAGVDWEQEIVTGRAIPGEYLALLVDMVTVVTAEAAR